MSSIPRPELDIEEAVARFFPRSTSYDHVAARRLIGWLNTCGYAITPKAAVEMPAPRREMAKPAGAKSEKTSRAALETIG